MLHIKRHRKDGNLKTRGGEGDCSTNGQLKPDNNNVDSNNKLPKNYATNKQTTNVPLLATNTTATFMLKVFTVTET